MSDREQEFEAIVIRIRELTDGDSEVWGKTPMPLVELLSELYGLIPPREEDVRCLECGRDYEPGYWDKKAEEDGDE